jgi:hypothetical protein
VITLAARVEEEYKKASRVMHPYFVSNDKLNSIIKKNFKAKWIVERKEFTERLSESE